MISRSTLSGATKTANAKATASFAMDKKQEDHEDPEDLDDSEEQDEGHEVQEHLLRFSGAPAPEILRVTAASTMADEPSEPVVHVSDAHECNEGSTGPPCGNLNESGASMSDGASESSCTCCQCRQSI